MKTLVLLRMFYSKSKGLCTTLMLIMTLVIFMLCWVQATYDYSVKDIVYLDDKIGDTDIYMQYMPWDTETAVETINTLNSIEGVAKVFFNAFNIQIVNGKSYNFIYCPAELIEIFFECSVEETSQDGMTYCYSSYPDIKEGQVIELPDSKIIVKKTAPDGFKYIDYQSTGSSFSVDQLLGFRELIFVPVDDINDSRLSNLYIYENFYVRYDDNISEEQREEIKSNKFIDFSRLTIREVVDDSMQLVVKDIELRLIIPRIAIGVVTFSCCVITVLMVKQKLKEYAIYYLCGCSKIRILTICLIGVTLIVIIPVILNLILILNYESCFSKYIHLGDVLYSADHIYITVGFMIANLSLSGIIEAIMIAKMSPVELYRRMTR